MRVPNLGEIELLVPLHEGMFEAPMWSTFLDRLRNAAGCDFAALLFRTEASANTIQLDSGTGAASGRLTEMFENTGETLAQGQQRAMRDGRVYTLQELLQMEGVKRQTSPDTSQFLANLAHLRAVRTRSEGGFEAWLVLASSTPMTVTESNLLTALVPHLRVALKVLARMEREKARASMTAGAFSHINFGWISIDASCRIVDRDEQAEQFMSRSGALRVGPYNRLTPSSPAIDRQLTALAKEFARDPEARPRAINLSQDPWIDILVSPVRVQALSGDSKAVAVVYFRGEANSSADRCQQLVDVFKLTQSEARFAWSIAQGMAIAEAAEQHGLTIETARNYSKKIYSKTGAKGQVDFMRRVLTSVVALTVH